MRRFIFAAIAVAPLAVQGQPTNSNLYIFGNVGYAIPNDATYGNARYDVRLQFDNVVSGGGGVGFNVSPHVRLEGEYFYIGNKVESADGYPLDTAGVSLETNHHHIFANLMFDLTDRGIKPYVGGGIGAVIVDGTQKYNTIYISPDYVTHRIHHVESESTAAFAGQVKAGASIPLGERIELFGGYRGVFNADQDFEQVSITGFFTNIVEGGVRIHF